MLFVYTTDNPFSGAKKTAYMYISQVNRDLNYKKVGSRTETDRTQI